MSGNRSAEPFVDEQGVLVDLAGRLDAGEHLLLLGLAGIGKTRLAAELCGQAKASGRSVDRLMASAATSDFKFGALRSLIPGDVVAASDLPSLFGRYLDRWRAMRYLDAPVLVWLDDTQHLDDMSAAVLRHAVAADVVQLVGTHRVPEAFPDDIQAMLNEGAFSAYDVDPLSRADSLRLAKQSAATELTEEDFDQIWRLSDGYPLFVRDLARAQGHTTGAIASFDGVIAQRFATLSSRLKETVELVALAQPVHVDTLGDRNSEITMLLSSGLVCHHDDTSLRIEHPLYASWILRNLGTRSTELFGVLADRIRLVDMDDATKTDILLKAGRVPDLQLALGAARLALARQDAPTARRCLPYVESAHDLVLGRILLVEDRIEEGVALLEQVVRETVKPDIRVEAASHLARVVGLMLGDSDKAHAILEAADRQTSELRLRRQLLLGRLWLWLFGASDRTAAAGHIEQMLSDDIPPDQSAYEIAVSGAGLLLFSSGPSAAGPVLERIHEIEKRIAPDSDSVSRARSIEAWFAALSGDLPHSLTIVSKRLAQPEAQTSALGLTILGAMTSYLSALAGRLHASLAQAQAGLDAARPVDWFRMGEITRLTDQGNRVLAGQSDEPFHMTPRSLEVDSNTNDLEFMLQTRARLLVAEARGDRLDAEESLVTLELLRSNEKIGWITIFAAELVDVRTDDRVSRLVVDCLEGYDLVGIAQAVAVASKGRLRQSPDQLLAAAVIFEHAGMPAAAVRCFADVSRLGNSEAHFKAAQGIVRSQIRWDGAPMPWLSDVGGLPTTRQIEVAELAIRTQISHTAETLYLARRTVENHLYRAYKLLGVNGLDELRSVLTTPEI